VQNEHDNITDDVSQMIWFQ